MPLRIEIDGQPVNPKVLELRNDLYHGPEGSFSGFFADDFQPELGQTVCVVALRHLPRWRHWIALFAERFLGRPYPAEVIFVGSIDHMTRSYGKTDVHFTDPARFLIRD